MDAWCSLHDATSSQDLICLAFMSHSLHRYICLWYVLWADIKGGLFWKKFRLLTSICSSYSLWYGTLSDSRCHLFLFYSHRIHTHTHTHQRMTFHNIITTFEHLSLPALFTVLYMNSLSYSHSPCREPKQHDATTTMLQFQDERIRRRAVNQHILILGLSVRSSL